MENNFRPDNVSENKDITVLFDLDGVLLDTEGLYTEFWNKIGHDYLNMPDIGPKIKGQSLTQIINDYFVGRPDVQSMINDKLYEFEYLMDYNYVPGAEEFLKQLKEHNIPTAVVTSSNRVKMNHVYRKRPEFKDYFTEIFTSETFTRSKPAPDCYLMAMDALGATPGSTVIFEDSFSGLQAADAAGGIVVGLATTNPREAIEDKAALVIDDFTAMDVNRLMAVVQGEKED